MTDPSDFSAHIAYRIAYGDAARKLERLHFVPPEWRSDGALDRLKARLLEEASAEGVLPAGVQKVVPGVGLTGWPADVDGSSTAVTLARRMLG